MTLRTFRIISLARIWDKFIQTKNKTTNEKNRKIFTGMRPRHDGQSQKLIRTVRIRLHDRRTRESVTHRNKLLSRNGLFYECYQRVGEISVGRHGESDSGLSFY